MTFDTCETLEQLEAAHNQAIGHEHELSRRFHAQLRRKQAKRYQAYQQAKKRLSEVKTG